MAEAGASSPAERLLRHPLPQPDARSCGAASMRVAELLRAAAAPPVLTGFHAEVLALHRRLTSGRDGRGRLQLPWPQALGTPPWAVARHLAGLTGQAYRSRWIRTGDPVPDVAGATSHAPVGLYVGNAWLPRHVVLVVGGTDEVLAVYEPTSGRLVTVGHEALRSRRLRLAGWDVPWFSVRPAARRTPA
ncbi:hypothetical protein ACFP3Q_05450 [Nocardioides sp. GCM10027113]|uniref:hypothetical protein n=1 Tax=unclassified Nocardioides TaxID=2615069 RepID=UPI00361DAE07